MKLFLIAFLLTSSLCSVQAQYRIEIKEWREGVRFIAAYKHYSRDKLCVVGEAIVDEKKQIKTSFSIICEDELVMRVDKTPEMRDPDIKILKNATLKRILYGDKILTFVSIHAPGVRAVPLPEEGYYMIDSDGHIHKPTPEEMVVIWKNT